MKKLSKRFVCTLLVAAMVMASTMAAYAANISDVASNMFKPVTQEKTEEAVTVEVDPSELDYVPNAKDISVWARDAVKVLRDVSAVPDEFLTKFSDKITREEFAMLAVSIYKKAVTIPIAAINNEFKDIGKSIYKKDIADAYSLGIVNGVTSEKFNPTGFITRQEICAMLVRLIKAVDKDIVTVVEDKITFTDAKDISAWALNDVKYAFKNKIMSGVAANTIAPLSNATREQAMTLIYRLAVNYKYIKEYSREELDKLKLRKNENLEGVEEYIASAPEAPRKYFEDLMAKLDYDMARIIRNNGVLVYLDGEGTVSLTLHNTGPTVSMSYSAAYSEYGTYKKVFYDALSLSEGSDKMVQFCEKTFKDHSVRYKDTIADAWDNSSQASLSGKDYLLICASSWDEKLSSNKFGASVAISYK